MHVLARHPKTATKVSLARELYNHFGGQRRAEQVLANAWKAARERTITVGDRSLSVLQLLQKKEYTLTLHRILATLRPDLASNQEWLLAWERRLLAAVLPDGVPVPWQ
jgi:hypothetical protein